MTFLLPPDIKVLKSEIDKLDTGQLETAPSLIDYRPLLHAKFAGNYLRILSGILFIKM